MNAIKSPSAGVRKIFVTTVGKKQFLLKFTYIHNQLKL